MPSSDLSNQQAAHYDSILDDYERHYFDACSMAFREEFMYEPLFTGLDLNGLKVIDLAAGSGYNSLALARRFPDAEIYGLDISEEACKRYGEIVGRPVFQADLTQRPDLGERFDAAMVFGGLHHCVSDLKGALDAVASMLRPGGLLLMCEPNSHYFLEPMRRLWYRLDRYFESATEAALAHDALARLAAEEFQPEKVVHFGGPASMLIYNSMVFRLPASAKRGLTAPLMAVERIYNRLPGRLFFSAFVARWRRLGDR